MGIIELVLLAVGLAMDAFAVAMCKGIACRRHVGRSALVVGLYFGAFQALMPLIGYFLGKSAAQYIERYDHWIAFALLLFIGLKMLISSLEKDGDKQSSDTLAPRAMLPLAIATSIDALAVGVTFSLVDVVLWLAIGLIGVITFALSAVGVWLGSVVGARFKRLAEGVGGTVLILIGVKILLEHLGILKL